MLLTIGDGDAEGRAAYFRRVLRVGLGGVGGIVVAPEPGHLFEEFGGSFAGAVRAGVEELWSRFGGCIAVGPVAASSGYYEVGMIF